MHYVSRRLLLRALPVPVVLGLLFLIGTTGYHVLEDWDWFDALYMTIITVSTVGFGEVQPLSPAGKLFTAFLIVAGAGLVAYMFGTAAQVLVRGEWRTELERRWRRKMFKQLNDHAIICGYGRVGRHVARELGHEGVKFVVVDSDAERMAELAVDDRPTLQGDATDEATLIEAGIERARYLIAALSSDADNVFAVLTARSLNPALTIVSRANSEESEPKLLTAGANRVITPYQISARRMITMVLRPEIGDFLDEVMHAGTLELLLEQAVIPDGSPLVGKTLAEADLRRLTGVTVLACRLPDAKLVHAPQPDTHLGPGARLVVLGTREQLDGFNRMATAGA